MELLVTVLGRGLSYPLEQLRNRPCAKATYRTSLGSYVGIDLGRDLTNKNILFFKLHVKLALQIYTKPNSSNKKTLEDLNIDDKKDGLLYIITMSIKLGVLKNLMTFENPKLL
uniref:Uncharacterized protein n=1 Tax=Physcomitrium patens TaxID=3218 RepID=A0A2K1KL71_PHYPA|nr:hypothetical protein PHYPA_008201 [Physcomitrium patens]